MSYILSSLWEFLILEAIVSESTCSYSEIEQKKGQNETERNALSRLCSYPKPLIASRSTGLSISRVSTEAAICATSRHRFNVLLY